MTTKGETTNTRRTRRDDSWDSLFAALVSFRDQNGHCNVPLHYKPNPSLGRWVSTQRFRGKVNALSDERIQQLDSIGFIWSVSDANWEKMFAALKRARQKMGHCNIPAKWPGNYKLSTWVANQRHKRKKGLMDPARVCRLEEIGFSWSAYTGATAGHATPKKVCDRKPPPPPPPPPGPEPNPLPEPECSENKIYNLAPGVYLEYDGHGPRPPELNDYIAVHDGEWPPYIPLPAVRVNFLMGNPFMKRRRRIPWEGCGKLEPDVFEYVVDNGVLPDWEPV